MEFREKMPRTNRIDVGGYVYHVLNRGVGRQQLFFDPSDYLAFERVLVEAAQRVWMRVLAYCLMPNHWHLVLWPLLDGDLSKFMQWLTTTHVARWHAYRETSGSGHLYQGRYKSFVCQSDAHLWTLIRYTERNARRANLVQRADQWQFSSLWRWERGSELQRGLLTEWPIPRPDDWSTRVDQPLTVAELSEIRTCSRYELPYGDDDFVARTIERFGLESRTRRPGRPKKPS